MLDKIRWWCSAFFLCLWLMPVGAVLAAEEAAVISAEPAELKVANRSIILFRATLLGDTPRTRVRHAKAVIDEILGSTVNPKIKLDTIQTSYMVLIDDRRALIVSPKDLGPNDTSVKQLAEETAAALRLVVTESAEARSIRFMLIAAGLSVLATIVYVVLLRLLTKFDEKARSWLPKRIRKHTSGLAVGHTPLLDSSNLYLLVRRLLKLLRGVLVLLITYQWLTFVLRRFPYTRPWGESLHQYLIDLARYVFDGMVASIPGLSIAITIFFIAKGISTFCKRLLQRMSRPGTIKWLSDETLLPTTRLTSLAIWLFALAMAYPYLPGAGTEAFKGLSVLIGLMISLGASSVVGQAAAGLILTYTRTLRPGEYVQVAGNEGTVTEVGMFTTTIRTGLGEVLTIPNSMITGNVTRNYSRTVHGPGYVVDTVVTIGYDTPWRQVEAMLLEAARRTDGVVNDPGPVVFQTALSDFYPEYRLVAQAIPSAPRPRAELLSMLHANIQDVFNEYGVQIMSPHYLGDPDQEKWVPKDKWYTAPASEPVRQEEPR